MKLSNVCNFINGGAWKEKEYLNYGIPVVQVSNMKNGTINISDLKYLSQTSYDRYKKHSLKVNDLIIATVGSHSTQGSAAGRATLVKGFAAGMLLNQNAVVIRSKSKLMDQRYLGLIGRSKKFQAYLGTIGQGAANQVRIALSGIKKFDCNLPPIEDQRRIANIISDFDDLIDINRSQIQLLEESARLLFREWFVYFRFPGHEKVKIVDGVPEGWRFAKVKDLGQIVTGKTPSKKNIRNFDGNVPFIKTPDMHQSWIILNTGETLSEIGASLQNNKYLPPWSVLVSCIGTVGVVAMNLFKSQTNQQINSVIPKNKFYRYYSFFCLSNIKPLLEAIGGGSTMTNINKNKFENIKINIPSENVLAEFYQTVNPIFNQIALLIDQNQKLPQARDLLLPRLMSGEIEV